VQRHCFPGGAHGSETGTWCEMVLEVLAGDM
jgi:hypothetical protein